MKRIIKTYDKLPTQMLVLPVFLTITEGNQCDI